MRILYTALASIALALSAQSATAEFSKVDAQSEFLALVEGKDLTRPLVEVQVTPDGAITGYGAAWSVTGEWTWENGYFCRDLYWGGDSLGYNCQEVRTDGQNIRFTSDRGTGDSAEFRLR